MFNLNADYFRKCSLFVSKEETRHYLQGVHITRHESGQGVYLVATDRHRMAVFYDRDGDMGDHEDAIILLPKEMASHIKKTCRRGDKRQALMIDPECKPVNTMSLDGFTLHGSYFIDGSFPSWQRCLPAMDCTETGNIPPLSAAYLSVYREVTAMGQNDTFIQIIGNQPAGEKFMPGPLGIRTNNPDFYGCLMPVAADKCGAECVRPEWLFNRNLKTEIAA